MRCKIACAAGARALPAPKKPAASSTDKSSTSAMLSPPNPPALAFLADRGDAGHHPEVGVDHPGAVAGRTGALGVGAEQGWLHAVGLREHLADRLQQTGVRRRVAPPRATD